MRWPVKKLCLNKNICPKIPKIFSIRARHKGAPWLFLRRCPSLHEIIAAGGGRLATDHGGDSRHNQSSVLSLSWALITTTNNIYLYYSIILSTKEKNISHKCKGRQPPTKVYKNINQQSYQNCQLRSQEPASSRSLSSLYCIIICNCMIVWCWAQKSDEKYLHLKFPSKVQPQVTSNIHKCNHF